MASASEQIIACSNVIDEMLKRGVDDRGLTSQVVSGHLRNLVEAVFVALHKGADHSLEYEYISESLINLPQGSEYYFLHRFHKFLRSGFSHYTLESDPSERLMLKYFEYLVKLRNFCLDELNIVILNNLDKFQLNTDPALTEYHSAIAKQIEVERNNLNESSTHAERYYIDRIRPFFVQSRVYYEVTFKNATDYSTKADRLIAFTNIDIGGQYATRLWLRPVAIDVVGENLPIWLIERFSVSIRPVELTNLGRILAEDSKKVNAQSIEYLNLSEILTRTGQSLLDIVLLDDSNFVLTLDELKYGAKTSYISTMLTHARAHIQSNKGGSNTLRFLLSNMNNRVLKNQIAGPNDRKLLGGLNVSSQCYPFEKMPYASSPRKNNVRVSEVLESISLNGREHEFLNRKIKKQIENQGSPYIKVEDVVGEGLDRQQAEAALTPLVDEFNRNLGKMHHSRKMVIDKGQIFIQEYEDTVAAIIIRLRELQTPVPGYSAFAKSWEAGQGVESALKTPVMLDDDRKAEILPKLFEKSHVAVLYGAAGTGKTTMVNVVASLFSMHRKLFLAHTNPAVDNLRRKLNYDGKSEFRTISRHNHTRDISHYELLVIDECSTVDNEALLNVLTKTNFNKLLLVGDNYQLEPIEFGNWFGVARQYLNKSSVFELTTPFRSTDKGLLRLWKKVRNIEDDIEEELARGGYARPLDSSFFKSVGGANGDEITLCLNYDGLYGINNLNRFMQSVRPGKSVNWNSTVYKVGDPVLFTESLRFKGLIYNNLKGRILDFDEHDDFITFDIDIERDESDIASNCMPDAHHLGGTKVRFKINRWSDEDDDSEDTSSVVPFGVAYAVSIHKAQGLEYETVKLVITADNEALVTHNIFYTAITRARKNLEIYWSPEAQNSIVAAFSRADDRKTIGMLKARQKI
ncbi:ATP-dependent DNA helicase [Corynebacterium casei]|uniref:ATP-dependent DNA helicase n=1 Tax=Corynebacterium casei TaxID=160386 RepID=UPI003FD4211C